MIQIHDDVALLFGWQVAPTAESARGQFQGTV
jgi:hypothetical protein